MVRGTSTQTLPAVLVSIGAVEATRLFAGLDTVDGQGGKKRGLLQIE